MFLIGYLVVRAFSKYGQSEPSVNGKQNVSKKGADASKKVSKEIGEYVDYEEVKKEDS